MIKAYVRLKAYSGQSAIAKKVHIVDDLEGRLITVVLDKQGGVRVSQRFSQMLMPVSELEMASEAFALTAKVADALLIYDEAEREAALEAVVSNQS